MYKRLPTKEKIVLINRVLHGEKVSYICKEANVSRTIFYSWLKKYRSYLSLKNRDIFASKIVKGKNHWKSLSLKTEQEIIKLALKEPANSAQKIAEIINEMDSRLRGNDVGGGYISSHGVWNVLRRNGLNTRKNRDLYISKYGRSSIKNPAYREKLIMIERYERAERAHIICRDFAVSRTLFYKWLKRYKEAKNDTDALNDLRPKGEKHWRFVAGSTEMVLDLVTEHPEYSINRLTTQIQAKGVDKAAGRHGIYNILKRLDLNTYEKRLAYARAKVPVTVPKPQIAEVSLPPQPRYSFLSFLSPPLRNYFSSSFGVTTSLCLIIILIPIVLLSSFLPADSFGQRIAYFIAFISLLCGLFFFLYSFKYYLSIAYVLSFSRREEAASSKLRGIGGFLAGVFGVSISVENEESPQPPLIKGAAHRAGDLRAGLGLQADLSHVVLERNPFVSVHVSTYNEKRVIDRLLTACTSFDYPNYEVIVADDSNDETVGLLEKWAHNPKIKISHREKREGYKGGALQQALSVTDRRAEFVLVFDADFIPYPDTITQFLKYFQLSTGTLDFSSVVIPSEVEGSHTYHAAHSYEIPPRASLGRNDKGSNIAAVQGYQWHVLNKSENWITRGVRSEYAGSYVIERSGAELYQGLKQISGSVYMIRRDILQSIGWGKSLTEDFELTLKLYEAGYKVVYTPYIQAPAEAVSTIKRLIRQRMRWAEGHSFNIKHMLIPLLFGRWVEKNDSAFKENSKFKIPNSKQIQNPNDQISKLQEKGRLFISSPLTRSEKLELVYLAPYYLQAALFILGTTCWFVAEVIFQVRLPFWTEVWGWSLVATNLFALPLMNMIGMFMEEAEEKDYLGLISFVVLSYIVAPFQAYAAVKGFLEKEEGPWFRTPKTGRITDTLMPGRIARFVRGIFGRHSPAQYKKSIKPLEIGNSNAYFAMATANNQFGSFKIRRKNIRWAGNLSVVVLLIISTLLANIANTMSFSESAYASKPEIKTVGDTKPTPDNKKQPDLGISSEETSKKEPKNKDKIIKNAEAKEISGYRSIVKKTHGGETVEFIFHESAKVRIKLGHREFEFQTNNVGGERINPKSAKIYKDKEVIYEEIVKGIDLRYTVNGDLITEEFIVKNREAASHFLKGKTGTIEQTVQTVDVKVVSPGKEKTFGFFTDTGKEIFKFASPFASDNDGKVSNDISISLKKSSIGHKLTKTLGASALSWLVDPKRAYPVSVDPTVVVSGGIVETEVQFGGQQRKLAAPNNWCNDTSGITCTSSWTKRRKITFDNSASAENLIDFPVLVKLNSSRIDYANTQSAGQDLRFVDRSNNAVVLSHEIEEFNETGDDYVWVKVPQIDAGSTTDYIWMYYGNAGIGDGADAVNVWNSNYKGVWHLREDPGGSAPQIQDSTTNNDDGTSNGTMTSGNQVAGQVDGSLNFDGTDDYIAIADNAVFNLTNTGTYSWSFWVKPDDFEEWNAPLTQLTTSGSAANALFISAHTTTDATAGPVTAGISVTWGDLSGNNLGAHTTNSVLSVGTWSHVEITYDGSLAQASRFAIYVDGVSRLNAGDVLSTGTISSISPTVFDIGYDTFAGENQDGLIDDVRFSSTNRSADWAEAEYKSGADTINSFGSEEAVTTVLIPLYAFYNDGGIVSYKKSTDGGSSWGNAVTVSDGDTDNYNPSIDVSGGIIHVFWIDDDGETAQGRRIDTDSSDAQGTICTGSNQGTIGSTYMVTVAADSATEAVVAFTDSSSDTEFNVFDVTGLDATCAAASFTTDLTPGNMNAFGSGITGSDRPVVFALSGTKVGMVFQDGNLSYSEIDTASDDWTKNNLTIASVTDNIYSVTTDAAATPKFWILTANISDATDTNFYTCCTNDIVETEIDSDAGGNGQDNLSDIDMYCPAATDCKVVYTDDIDTATPNVVFRDCDNNVCSTGTSTIIDADVGDTGDYANPSIYCVAADNCKVVYGDDLNGATPKHQFLDCDSATQCDTTPTPFNLMADFGGATDVPQTSIDCVGGDTDCKVVVNDAIATNLDLSFIDCSAANCNVTTLNDIDASAGSQPKNDMYCITATNCKVVHHDVQQGVITFTNCGSATTPATCAGLSGDATNIDAGAGTTEGTNDVAVDCVGGDTDCKVLFSDSADGDLTFVDCSSAICAVGTTTDIDILGANNGTNAPSVSMVCPTVTNCKFTYVGNTTAGSETIYFGDCNDGNCATGTVYELPQAPRFKARVVCPAATDCKIAYYDGSTATEPTVQFADCDTEDCFPSVIDDTDPWQASGSNIETVSLTYDSTNSDLYAHIIQDASDQAYWKMTDATTISWGSQTSYGFTAGTLGEISSPISAPGTNSIGVVLHRATADNFEFAPLPENSLILLAILPLLPKLLKRLRRRRRHSVLLYLKE